MDYGIRTPEVHNLVESLRSLHKSEWDASLRSMLLTYGPPEASQSHAAIVIETFAQRHSLLGELDSAREHAESEVVALQWPDHATLSYCVSLVVGAIVVADVAPFEELESVFWPFLGTSVRLPLQGAD